MSYKRIKIEEEEIINKFFRFSESAKNYVLRTKQMERELLTSILNTTNLKCDNSIQFAEENGKRDGCYAIIGLSHNTVFKLISGRRYENKFVLFNEKEVNQIQEDYDKFYSLLKKSDFIIPDSLGTYTIELNLKNQRRFLFLEQQEKFAEDNLLNLYNTGIIREQQLLKEFKIILTLVPSLFPFIKNGFGFDVVIPNFLPGGKYIDLLPPKIKNGYEYEQLIKTYYSEYSRIKLHRMFTQVGIVAHAASTFIATAPSLALSFIDLVLEVYKDTKYYETLLKFFKSKKFRLYLNYDIYYFRNNLSRPTIPEDELGQITDKITKYINSRYE